MVVRSCITFLCDNKINTEIYVQHDELVEQTERLKKNLRKCEKLRTLCIYRQRRHLFLCRWSQSFS